MTASPTYKTCRFCGREFVASKADFTVHCPAHRTRESRKVAKPATGPAVVSSAGRTCTVTSAVAGRCGKPAVYAFTSSTGEVFAECAEHHA